MIDSIGFRFIEKANREINNKITEAITASVRAKYLLKIEKVIFNKPATIVIWNDGCKTIVKAGKGEKYDKEKGLALCISKRLYGGNKGSYYNEFKKWLDN